MFEKAVFFQHALQNEKKPDSVPKYFMETCLLFDWRSFIGQYFLDSSSYFKLFFGFDCPEVRCHPMQLQYLIQTIGLLFYLGGATSESIEPKMGFSYFEIKFMKNSHDQYFLTFDDASSIFIFVMIGCFFH